MDETQTPKQIAEKIVDSIIDDLIHRQRLGDAWRQLPMEQLAHIRMIWVRCAETKIP